MKLDTDCWLVIYSDGKRAEAGIDNIAFDALFEGNRKTSNLPGSPGRGSKVTALFQNLYIGDRRR